MSAKQYVVGGALYPIAYQETGNYQPVAAGVGVQDTSASGGGGATVALTGVSATGSEGTLRPTLNKALTGIQGTGGEGQLGSNRSVALTGVSATGFLGHLSPNTSGPVTVALTGIQATGFLGTLTPSVLIVSGDSNDPGIRKYLKNQEARRKKLFDEDRAKRERRKAQIIDAFERVVEGKPGIPEVVAEEIVAALEARPDPESTFDFEALVQNASKIQQLWDEYLERDDEEVLMLL